MKRALEIVINTAAFTLTLIGIGGIAWRIFFGGWLERLAGFVWAAEVRSPLLTTTVIIGVALAAWYFLRGGLKIGQSGWAANLMVTAASLCGAYFAYEWIRHMF